jgi:NADH-quinone oxidoreductase subunit J
MAGSYILFFILAIAAVAAAVGMLVSRSAVYSALFLIVNFSTTAVIYLTLGAPFIALAQITVYAGAIMILFLFVIMLLGSERLPVRSAAPRWLQGLGLALGILVMAEAAYLIVIRSGLTAPLVIPSADFASPTAIGLTLFNQYLLPFEITSVLLLVAVVGAIVLTRTEKIARGRNVISAETRSLDTVQPKIEQPDLMEYEKQIEAEEIKEDLAGPDQDEVARR